MAIGRLLCCSFIVNALCLCFLFCSRFSSLNTKLTWSCINRYRFVEVTNAEEALFYKSPRQHNIRHLACTSRPKAYFAQELPVTEILTQLSGYVSCPWSESPPPSRLLAPFLRGLWLSFFARKPHGGNACYAG